MPDSNITTGGSVPASADSVANATGTPAPAPASGDSASNNANGSANGGGETAPVPTAEQAPSDSVISILTDSAKLATLRELIPERVTFDSLESALAALKTAAEKTENFWGLPIALKGVNSEGEIDESLYANAIPALATVGTRTANADGKQVVGVKGIVLFPIPTAEAFLSAGDSGEAFIRKVVEKEIALVAFRPFRDADTVNQFSAAMDMVPGTVEAFLTESTRAKVAQSDTFDALWKDFRDSLKKDQPVLSQALPSGGKPEVIKAIRSKSYAETHYPELEKRGLFVRIAEVIMEAASRAQPEPLETQSIRNWLATREELDLGKTERSIDFSLLDAVKF